MFLSQFLSYLSDIKYVCCACFCEVCTHEILRIANGLNRVRSEFKETVNL